MLKEAKGKHGSWSNKLAEDGGEQYKTLTRCIIGIKQTNFLMPRATSILGFIKYSAIIPHKDPVWQDVSFTLQILLAVTTNIWIF